MIRIAVDGPGGAGKSTVAKAVAKELGIIYVDTGALYRTIGLFMLRNGIDPKDHDGVCSMLGKFTLELTFTDGKQTVLLNGEDVGDKIRTPEVSMAASAVSAIGEVREFLLDTQRSIAMKNSVIMDGRDIGTVILPNAEVKIFLTASPEARAQRRYKELLARGQDVKYEDVFNEMAERDKNDSTREIAPCVPAEDAEYLDNSNLDLEGTTKAILKIVKKKERKVNRLYKVLYAILAPMIRFFQRVKATGVENIPKEGPILICSNHMAIRDPILIAAASPRQISFLGKKELFKVPVIGWLVKNLGAIPLDRSGTDLGAIKKSVNILKDGKMLALFPQGHRYPGVNPAETPKKNGAALLSFRSKCDVLPVCIKTRGFKYSLFCRKEIIFGKPIPYSELGFVNGGNDEYKIATEKIFSEIIKLGGFDKLPVNNSSDGDA
ncbi:MAG: (d)CMP kinase [Clostridia bacterium]|nr:(d)CMP kinase [Clostridia bacterium]